MKRELIRRIESKEAVIGIIGMGYVGLPLALRFSEAGFWTRGFDLDTSKADSIASRQSYLAHISDVRIGAAVDKGLAVTSDIARVADCPNVFAKLGGLAMPDNGFGWHERQLPPSSDEFVDAQSRYYHHAIACFGPERCMFESNFPVDRLSVGYRVLWNALKKMAADYSPAEQDLMFSGVARKVYRLSPSS